MVVRSDRGAREPTSATASESPKAQLRDAPHNPDAEARVADLAANAGIVSERELVELYRLWAGQPDKVWARRKIIEEKYGDCTIEIEFAVPKDRIRAFT